MQRPLIHQEEGPLVTPRQAAHGLDAPHIRSSCPHSLTWRQREGERAWTICRVGDLTQPDAIRRGTSTPAVLPRIWFGTTESRPPMKTVWNRPRLIKTIQEVIPRRISPSSPFTPSEVHNPQTRSDPAQRVLVTRYAAPADVDPTPDARRQHTEAVVDPEEALDWVDRRPWWLIVTICLLFVLLVVASFFASNSTGRRTHGRPGIRPRPPVTAPKPTRLPTYLYRCWPANNARPRSRTREIWRVWS